MFVSVPGRGDARVAIVGLELAPLAASGFLGVPPTDSVLLHPVTLQAIDLGSVGIKLWRALRDAGTVDEAVRRAAALFDAPPERIAADMAVFLDSLEANGLIAECPAQSPAGTQRAEISLRVTAIVAAHNRRETTLRCLRSLFACVPEGCELTAVVVDDGSSDGTAQAVANLGLPVTVVAGPGDWYWSRSMAEAERVAELDDPDLIVWLNDDVVLDPTALPRVIDNHAVAPEAILAGALWSSQRGDVSFTGMRSTSDGRRAADGGGVGAGAQGTRMRRLAPNGEVQPIDAFHGNFVVVPRAARRAIGPIDGSWPHHYADLDYAARAQEHAVQMLLLPGLMGLCEPHIATWSDPDAPWAARVRSVFGRKGWPPRAHWRFLRRHGKGSSWATEANVYAGVITGASVHRPPRLRLLQWVGQSSTESRTGRAAHEPAAPWQQPTLAADLIRLGPPRDGGYVVSRNAVMAAGHLISGGLADDWAFEEAFRELNPVPVTVYDGTMGWSFWLSWTWRAVAELFRERGVNGAADLGRWRRYLSFFSQPGVEHVQRNLTATGTGAVSLADAFERLPEGDVFVKLDIEGGEYALFGALVANRARITGLVMEVHGVSAHAARLTEFIARFDTHVLTFVRTNNAGGVDEVGQPRLLEMTWTRRDLFVPGEPDLGPLTYFNV